MKANWAVVAFALLVVAARADVAPPSPAPGETAANKAIVAEMFQKLFVERNMDEAAAYLAPDFIEHNPGSTDGIKALKAFFKDVYAKAPNTSVEVKRIIAEGDLVFVHFHWKNDPQDRGLAGVDIFRLVDGKIVEHWDVTQPVPEKSANNNTMF